MLYSPFAALKPGRADGVPRLIDDDHVFGLFVSYHYAGSSYSWKSSIRPFTPLWSIVVALKVIHLYHVYNALLV
mgnify:CR=1 FL=1